MNTVNHELVEALGAVDAAVLGAVARMIEHLRTAADLRTAAVDPAGFGIDEHSPQWEVFMRVIEEFDRSEPGGDTHEALAGRLAGFAGAVEVALAQTAQAGGGR